MNPNRVPAGEQSPALSAIAAEDFAAQFAAAAATVDYNRSLFAGFDNVTFAVCVSRRAYRWLRQNREALPAALKGITISEDPNLQRGAMQVFTVQTIPPPAMPESTEEAP